MFRIRVGEVFQGRYKLLEKLSEGGFGLVHKARQLTTGQYVAIKFMRSPDPRHADVIKTETLIERFRREIALCAELNHPNIVQLIDSGELDDGTLFTVFEFIPGRDLARVLAEEGQLHPEEAGYLMGQVLDALSSAHELGIVHRDLKPANIMIAHTGARRNAKVLDFGIAGIMADAGDDGETQAITAPVDRVGTPAYAAPEQLRGKPATSRSDMYAWGLVFIECLTGQRVIQGETIPDTIFRQLDPTPITIPPFIARHPLGRLLKAVTTKDVEARKLSAVQALRRLERYHLSDLVWPEGTPAAVGGGFAERGQATMDTLDVTPQASMVPAHAPHLGPAPGTRPHTKPHTKPHDRPDGHLGTGPADTQADRVYAPQVEQAGDTDVTLMVSPSSEGERRQITALAYEFHFAADAAAGGDDSTYVDIDIDEQAEMLIEYKNLCQRAIVDSGGYVASTLSNRILAFYGYPRARADDARRAVLTAIDVLSTITDLQLTGGFSTGTRSEVSVGAHTGLVLIRPTSDDGVGGGMHGGPHPGEVFGDTPGIAGHICDVTPRGAMTVSATTRRVVRHHIAFGRSFRHQVGPGRRPVELFAVVGRRPDDHGHTISSGHITSRPDGMLPLVGRAEELALLERAWRLAHEGRGQTILITGEAGIGKSRLAHELARVVAGQEHNWFEARCVLDGQHSTLQPIVDLLERRLNFHDGLMPEDKANRLEGLLTRYQLDPSEAMPILAPLLHVPLARRYAPLSVSAQVQRDLTLRALVALVSEVALQAPLIFIVEDLHWADPTTLALLRLIIEAVPTLSLCIVLTTRPPSEALLGQEDITRIQLSRLSTEGTRDILMRVTDHRPLPREVEIQILERTDGVPLFIEELIRSIIDSGMIKESDGAYQLSAPLSAIDVPATLRDSLMARLDSLNPAAKATVQLAAVVGREFSLAQLTLLSPLSESQLSPVLEELVSSDLVHRRRRISGDIYTFKHALVQDTAYDSLPKRTRRQYHATIGQLFESEFPELIQRRPEIFMHHYECAGKYDDAAHFAYAAGKAAVARSANEEAIAYAERALAWLSHIGDGERRHEIERAMTAILTPALMANYGYGSDRFRALLERARLPALANGTAGAGPAGPGMTPTGAAPAQATPTGVAASGGTSGFAPGSDAALLAMWGMFAYHFAHADHVEAGLLAEHYVAEARRASDSAHETAALTLLGISRYYQARFSEAQSSLEQAIHCYDPDENRNDPVRFNFDNRVLAEAYLGLTHWVLGQRENAFRHTDNALLRADSINHPLSQILALFFHAKICQFEGDHERVAGDATRIREVSEDKDMRRWSTVGAMLEGWARGDAALCRRALEEYRASGHRLRMTYWLELMAEVEMRAGATEHAIADVEEALALSRTTSEVSHTVRILIVAAECAEVLGDADKAEAQLREAVQLADSQRAKALHLQAALPLAELLKGRGMYGEAQTLLLQSLASFDDDADTPSKAAARQFLARLKNAS